MTSLQHVSRRTFLGQAAAVGAAGAASGVLYPAARARAAAGGGSDSIRLGFIGVGPRGASLLAEFRQHPDVQVTAICDVWQERLDAAIARCDGKPAAHRDYRELLARADVDAVVIASPPHWHALHAVHACEAGKDVYIEKPMTLTVAESRAIVDAVERHGRMSQVGTQIHAEPNYRRVVELVRSGALGAITVVRTFCVMNQGPEGIGTAPDGEPPAGLDWETWCGPAPRRAFNPLIVVGAYNHCSFWDYSGGWTPGMAPHILDLPYWALELGHPIRVSASGGRYVIRDVGDVPDVQEIVFQYPSLTMTWMMSLVNSYGFDFQGEGGINRRLGVYFHGVNGTLMANYGEYRLVPEGDRMSDPGAVEGAIPPSPGHAREWLDSLRTRRPPSCHVGYHHKVNVACALANVAYRVGRSIAFDPERETIPGDPEAAALLAPRYRAPWALPA